MATPAVLMSTADQIAQYRRDGFARVSRLLGPGELDRLRAEMLSLMARAPSDRGSTRDRAGNPVPGGPGHFNFTDCAESDPRTFKASAQGEHVRRKGTSVLP